MHHLRTAMQYRQVPLPKRGIPFKRLLQNLAWRRESQVSTLMPNFTVVALKVYRSLGLTAPKIVKNGNTNLPLREYSGGSPKKLNIDA